MHFIANSTIFKQALSIIKGAYSTSDRLPAILRCIKFHQEKNMLRLMATNTDIEICHDMDVEWESIESSNETAYGVPGEEMFKLFDLLPEDMKIEIIIDPDTFMVEVIHSFGSYECAGYNGEHFPNPIYEVVQKEKEDTVSFDLSQFKAGTDFVKSAVSNDLSRPGLNYVLLDAKHPCAVATTGTRIAKYDFGHPLVDLERSLMIDPKIIQNIATSNSTMSCTVTYDRQRISFAFGNTKVSGLTTTANFPKYLPVFQKDVIATGAFNRQELIQALRSVRAFYNSDSRVIILDASNMFCTITATDVESGKKGKTSFAMDLDGRGFSVLLDAQFLMDTVNDFDSDDLSIQATERGPYYIGVAGTNHAISAIMPISSH